MTIMNKRRRYSFGEKPPKASKIGIVITIRVNPTDAMAIIDMVDKLKLYTMGMSFSLATSIALRGMLEAMRHNNVIPTRDGSEFLDMLSRFPTEKEALARVRGRQLNITENFQLAHGGENSKITDLAGAIETEHEPTPEEVANYKGPDPETHENPEVRRLYHLLVEMDARKFADPLNFDEELYNKINSEMCKLI